MKTVAIPEKMEKFYGTGTMLHPDQDLIEDLLRKIPQGKVATIDTLCEKMASDHGTNVTCPMCTSNILKKMAEHLSTMEASIPFWRIIRANLLLINSKNLDFSVARLEEEGWQLERTKKGDYELLTKGKELFRF